MTARFEWDATLLQSLLMAAGFDIEFDHAWPGEDGGTLTARRERAGRAYLVILDGSGRVGVRVTVTEDEQARTAEIDGIALRVSDVTQHIALVSGTLRTSADLEALLGGLDAVATPGLPAISASWTDLPPPP